MCNYEENLFFYFNTSTATYAHSDLSNEQCSTRLTAVLWICVTLQMLTFHKYQMKETQTGLRFSQNGKTATRSIKVSENKHVEKKAPKHLSHSDLGRLKMMSLRTQAVLQRDTCGAARLHSMCRSALDSSE